MVSDRRFPGLALATLLAAFAAGVLAQAPLPPRILVMPFDNVGREASMVWLGEGAAVLLADDLNALGAAAITREERREAFERLQVPATAILSDATVIRIAQIVGASEVVTGALHLEGDTLVVRARAIAHRDRPHRSRRDRARAGSASVRDRRSDRAPACAVRDLRAGRAAAPAARGVRELRQGAADGNPRDRDRLSQRGAGGRADLRPCAGWRSGTSTPIRAIMRRRWRRCCRSPRIRPGRAAPGSWRRSPISI